MTKTIFWIRPKTDSISRNGCNFWFDTETNQNQQIQVILHYFFYQTTTLELKSDVILELRINQQFIW